MPPIQPDFFVSDLFIPRYHPDSGPFWKMRVVPLSINRGYWSEARWINTMTVLTRLGPEGEQTWMSTSPMEIESQEIGCRLAKGDTIVMGLGMGWAAANAALVPAVSRVTVIERDPEVIALIAGQDIWSQLPTEAAEKIRIIEDDALTYRPDKPVETLLADIWLPLNGDERVEEVRQMQANTRASQIYFWGQEMVIARRARALGLPLTQKTVADIIRELDLPLLGPALADYPDLIARAAAHRLTD